MTRKLSFLIVILVLTIGQLRAQVTIIVTQIPENTPDGDDIYIAGDFNGWDPGDTSFKLITNNESQLEIIIPEGQGGFEFKFTRGSWETVEGDESGGFINNRSFTFGNGETLELQIAGWEDLGTGSGSGSGNSTAASNVTIIDDAFDIPQLGRTRRIWLYLPPGYENSDVNYPVLYMHDGQNVFDAVTSFVGEWEVDETLNDLHEQGLDVPIVVAIDNGGVHRIDEYSPWVHTQYGGGEGDAYLDFIVNTLKPYVDQNYRTLPNRENTGISGSSMGGLISFYAGIRYPDVFGKLGVFSPSFPIFTDAFDAVNDIDLNHNYKIYIKSGARESDIARDSRRMYDKLIQLGLSSDQLKLDIPGDGEHSEWFWAREFEEVYLWMFSETDVTTEVLTTVSGSLRVFPNPARDNFQIISTFQNVGLRINIYNTIGAVVGSHQVLGDTIISTSALENGLYLLEMKHDKKSYYTKLIINK